MTLLYLVLDVTMQCQPNDIFDNGCHKCVCDPNGNYAMCYGQDYCHPPNMPLDGNLFLKRSA